MGIRTPEAVDIFLRAGISQHCVRILVEALETDRTDAVRTAGAISRRLREAGVTLPQLHRGEGAAAWAVIGAARQPNHEIRIGPEDTIQLRDGTPPRDKTALVAAAVTLVRSAYPGDRNSPYVRTPEARI